MANPNNDASLRGWRDAGGGRGASAGSTRPADRPRPVALQGRVTPTWGSACAPSRGIPREAGIWNDLVSGEYRPVVHPLDRAERLHDLPRLLRSIMNRTCVVRVPLTLPQNALCTQRPAQNVAEGVQCASAPAPVCNAPRLPSPGPAAEFAAAKLKRAPARLFSLSGTSGQTLRFEVTHWLGEFEQDHLGCAAHAWAR